VLSNSNVAAARAVKPARARRRYLSRGMRVRGVAFLAFAFILAGAFTVNAQAVTPRTSLPDVEDEVMCPTCGTPLNQAFSPQAERQRDFIRREIALGKTKEQIKQALVAEFGREVLAEPADEGFDLSASVVPIVAVLIAFLTLGVGVLKWRRRAPAATAERAPGISPADSARLERDISRYEL
jgi:cytochrome c-type biogenesis protein CcmH